LAFKLYSFLGSVTAFGGRFARLPHRRFTNISNPNLNCQVNWEKS
jgi:hypothetical protein